MLAQCVCVFSLDLSELNFSGQKCKAKELKITLLDAALLTGRHITGEMTDVWEKKKLCWCFLCVFFSF